jgi:hypothetical protein
MLTKIRAILFMIILPFDFDKVLLYTDGSIGGLFLPVKGYYASKSRGWRFDWEREVERCPALVS